MFPWHSKKYNFLPISDERKNILKKHAQQFKIPITEFELWDMALTHISFFDTSEGSSYERLEFLGDSVLGLCIADILFVEFTDLSEGKMSMIKSYLVNEKMLADIGREHQLLDIVKLGHGERLIDKRAQEKVLCDVFESTLATIFLNQGLQKSREFVKRLFFDKINLAIIDGVQDYKTHLQKVTVKTYKAYPTYTVIDVEGPDHGKIFTIEGEIDQFKAVSKGRSKKEAEQVVAQKIIQQMKEWCEKNPQSPLKKELSNN